MDSSNLEQISQKQLLLTKMLINLFDFLIQKLNMNKSKGVFNLVLKIHTQIDFHSINRGKKNE